jgi:hypothetical protein
MGSPQFLSTGEWGLIFLTGIVLAVPTSVLLLWLYRYAVQKAMRARSGREVSADSAAAGDGSTSSTDTLLLHEVDGAPEPRTPMTGAILESMTVGPRQAALVYSLGGLGHAITTTVLFFVSGGLAFLPVRTVLVTWAYAWPIVLTINLVAALDRRARIASVAAYFAGLMLVASSRGFVVSALQLWWHQNLLLTLILLVALGRRVRAVGPLVLVFMIIGAAGASFSIDSLAQKSVQDQVLHVTGALGVDQFAFELTILAGFVLAGVLGWVALAWIRRGYDAKRLSDQSITIDSIWLLFTVYHCIDLEVEWKGWAFVGLLSFGVYKAVSEVGFAWLRRRKRSPAHPRLVVLRVFGQGHRSEKLMGTVGARWRYAGSTSLIVGTDLATTLIEPHLFLEFIQGRLASRFIHDRAALEARLAEIETLPDFDGRHRVSEFFCHDDTWRMTLIALVARSDVILMDLRGFSPANQGCAFELRELVQVALLGRVVLIVNRTTDMTLLNDTLQEAWRTLNADSPNRGRNATAELCRLEADSPAERRKLMEAIAAACSPGGAALPGPAAMA